MKNLKKILVANRGEIAIRIMQAAAELNIATVAIYSVDDAHALHLRKADEAIALDGQGATVYLDIERIIAIAQRQGCDAIHPGYGFLSENADFAQKCAAANILFVGPAAATLALFGDKIQAKRLARTCDIPLLSGSEGRVDLAAAQAFFDSLSPHTHSQRAMLIKAVAGGGGRGMRIVRQVDELEEAFARCCSEAEKAFGNGAVYVEQFLPRARHIEIQIVGDGSEVAHLWERECSLQRRHQKLIEIAPSPSLSDSLREQLIAAALKLAETAHYLNVGTFEFLVNAELDSYDLPFAFIEANPRLQVEHTVTEQVTGIDLVQTQLRIAAGESLTDIGLKGEMPAPRGYAMQLRVNMETLAADGAVKPTGGALTRFEIPSGAGIRVDTAGFTGYHSSPHFDSLLAKLIAYSPSKHYPDVVKRAYRALCSFDIAGIATNKPILQNLLLHEDVQTNAVYTRFVEEHLSAINEQSELHPMLYHAENSKETVKAAGVDPLAVLDYGRTSNEINVDQISTSAGVGRPLLAPMQGTIVSIAVADGDIVKPGQEVLIMEAMKMEHVIAGECGGVVRSLVARIGDTVFEGDALAYIDEAEMGSVDTETEQDIDLDEVRADLAEVIERHRITLDEARPEAVAKRRKKQQRTARENVADLVDEGSLLEFGALTIAGRRLRSSVKELIARTPADGLITGIGLVNGQDFAPDQARCAIMAYDYTVLAGTQGYKNHEKKDRLIDVTMRRQLPLILFSEGGGGRPGDTDLLYSGWLHLKTFQQFAGLSGLVPMIGINSGYCFAGNAVLLGCCDIIIATENSNIGMGGPAMIEGGGLGVYQPTEVGPMSDQVPNGVVDIAVKDEAEAVAVAKKYLSYFQGSVKEWQSADQRWLRRAVPENRLRVYDIRKVIHTLADVDSVLELKPQFGHGMITALARIEGRPLAIIANNPQHLGGAIDSPAADKAARFMQICDAFDIPILFLCDTPGNMVGPEAEKTALVRHCCRLFVIGANLTVPFFTVVLRKAYGLGSQAMAGGGFHNPLFSVAWPTAEFGPMGLEGAVKLGYRDKLAAIADPEERRKVYDEMVAELYELDSPKFSKKSIACI